MKSLHLANVWLFGVSQWRTTVVPLYQSDAEVRSYQRGQAVVPTLLHFLWRLF
jgi:hypothetical protein